MLQAGRRGSYVLARSVIGVLLAAMGRTAPDLPLAVLGLAAIDLPFIAYAAGVPLPHCCSRARRELGRRARLRGGGVDGLLRCPASRGASSTRCRCDDARRGGVRESHYLARRGPEPGSGSKPEQCFPGIPQRQSRRVAVLRVGGDASGSPTSPFPPWRGSPVCLLRRRDVPGRAVGRGAQLADFLRRSRNGCAAQEVGLSAGARRPRAPPGRPAAVRAGTPAARAVLRRGVDPRHRRKNRPSTAPRSMP